MIICWRKMLQSEVDLIGILEKYSSHAVMILEKSLNLIANALSLDV